MTVPEGVRLSAEDQAKVDSGDYVWDAVHGLVPKDPQTQVRLARAAKEALVGDAAAAPAPVVPQPVVPTPKVKPAEIPPQS